jgi:membrane protease subunit (stomatin/prohibitin family)
VLTSLRTWDKAFKSPFKSDVYFFSTRIQTDQKWGTQQPITIRDKEFGSIRLRGFGIYSYHIDEPQTFHKKVSGTRDVYTTADLEGQLRSTVLARFADAFATSGIPFLDMAANQALLADKMKQVLAPSFKDYGLALDTFTVENLSLPDELQKRLDERIGMNIAGNLQQYTQFQVAQSIPIAAANQGGGAAATGAGLGAGMAMGKAMADAVGGAPGAGSTAATTKACTTCGKRIPAAAKFCAECGAAQA